jgi:hypothetical protein
MNPTPCRCLDDYLAHDLKGEELARFTGHLPACPDCAQAVRAAERLQTLLREATQLEALPPGLTQRLERRLRVRRRGHLVAALGLVAAAIVAAWLLRPTSEPVQTPAPKVEVGVVPDPPAPQASAAPAAVRVVFPRGANVVAVREKMESPNVTFFWVYPGLRQSSVPSSVEDGAVSSTRSDQ